MQNLIKAIARYVPLTDDDVLIIGQLFVQKELKVGDCFLSPGHICRDFAFIEKGLLSTLELLRYGLLVLYIVCL